MWLTIAAFTSLVIVLVTLFLSLNWLGTWFSSTTDTESNMNIFKTATDILLLIIELSAISFAIIVLHVYFQHRRRYKFVFEGFSNAGKLADSMNKPIVIDSLAQRELVHQFQIICDVLKDRYTKELNDSGDLRNKSLQSDQNKVETNDSILRRCARRLNPGPALRSAVHHILSGSRLRRIPVSIENIDFIEEKRLAESIWYLPSTEANKAILPEKIIRALVHSLKDMINSVEASGMSNKVSGMSTLQNAIEENTSKEIAPIMHLIDALIPPPIIKVICHLQSQDDAGGVGITLEVIDLSNQRIITNETLWRSPSSSNTEQFLKSSMAVNASTSAKSTLIEDYIALLGPAMRWLVLIFWELYAKESGARYGKHNHNRESYLPGLLYLLGALYYASADHFPVCSVFFRQCAFNRLCKVTDRYPDLTLPYFYLAERTLKKVKNSSRTNRGQLLLEMQEYYRYALTYAEEKNAPQTIKNNIIVREALAISQSDDLQFINKRALKIDNLTHSTLDSLRDEDCWIYLHNLGAWFANLGSSWYADLVSSWCPNKDLIKCDRVRDEDQKRARAYLISSFILKWEDKDTAKAYGRFSDEFDQFFKEFAEDLFEDEEGLTRLKGILKSVLVEKKVTSPMPTDQFLQAVKDNIIDPWSQATGKRVKIP